MSKKNENENKIFIQTSIKKRGFYKNNLSTITVITFCKVKQKYQQDVGIINEK